MGVIKRFMRRKSNAFTLIELIIVVAVLAIVAAAAITAFQNINQKAQIAQLKATLKSAREAIFMHRANNELNNFASDAGNCHPRVNFWPTYEEVRRGAYQDQLDGSIFDSALPDNPFIISPRTTPPAFSNFSPDCSGSIGYDIPGAELGNPRNNLVVASNQPKGTPCVINCPAAYIYNPETGEFWANCSSGAGGYCTSLGVNLW